MIVPSNKEGTGFLNHCYDNDYLSGHITEKEFNAIIVICSRIAAKAYSSKQIIDRQKTSKEMLFIMGLSTTIAILGIVLLMFSAIYNNVIIDYLASFLLAPAILMVFFLNLHTWKKGQPPPLTFNGMVKKDLDSFFEKVNSHYDKKTNQGISLATIDGHYWVEIHIDQKRKLDEFELESPKMIKQIRANLDYVISLAKVSSRGKSMLERDLNKMEEESEEEEEEDEGAEGGQYS